MEKKEVPYKLEPSTYGTNKQKMYIDSFVCRVSCFEIFLIQMKNYVVVHEKFLDDQLPIFRWNFRVDFHNHGERTWLQINDMLPGTERCWTRLDTGYLPGGQGEHQLYPYFLKRVGQLKQCMFFM